MIGYIKEYNGENGVLSTLTGVEYNFFGIHKEYYPKLFIGTLVYFELGKHEASDCAINILVPFLNFKDFSGETKSLLKGQPIYFGSEIYEPNENYFVFVKDKLNNVFGMLVTTDDTGGITLNEENLPKGFFTENFGAFNLIVTEFDELTHIKINYEKIVEYSEQYYSYKEIVFT